ncbi:hypothetical protein CKAH01_02749 [Colletotrichum kahawae]|uniref:Uncharacterized protein n=1 Tax=Colletotrichum kahawae TaxID=34407 RepID=A0AAE0CX88_COLKA|nr:hypothetical protein CKAH01_02749 [Colletotrichum kahawae]
MIRDTGVGSKVKVKSYFAPYLDNSNNNEDINRWKPAIHILPTQLCDGDKAKRVGQGGDAPYRTARHRSDAPGICSHLIWGPGWELEEGVGGGPCHGPSDVM